MGDLNFQMLEAHNVDIENFNYNVSELADNIFIGPQGELLESLERFNNRYSADLGITKSFTFKPGVYDKIKEVHSNHILRYDMRPRGIKSIFDRMDQYRWRLSNFKKDLLNLEKQMIELRSNGMKWQDNSDQFVEELEALKSNILSSLTQARDMYPNINISCKLIPLSYTRTQRIRRGGYYYSDRNYFPDDMFSEGTCADFIILFYIKIKNLQMYIDSKTNLLHCNLQDYILA